MQQPDAEQLLQLRTPRDAGEAQELYLNANRLSGSSYDWMASSGAFDSTTALDSGNSGAALRGTPLATSTPRKSARPASGLACDVGLNDSGHVDADTSGFQNAEFAACQQVPLQTRPALPSSAASWLEQQAGGGCWTNGEGAALWADACGRNPMQICVSLAASTQREAPYRNTRAATTHTSSAASNATGSHNGDVIADAIADPGVLSVCRLLTDKHYGPGLVEALHLQKKYRK